jgi:hypothetical protein
MSSLEIPRVFLLFYLVSNLTAICIDLRIVGQTEADICCHRDFIDKTDTKTVVTKPEETSETSKWF